MTSCSHCGLPIVTLHDDVPRCRKCNKPMCYPNLRDCAYEHYRVNHDHQQPARSIEEVRPL